MTAYAFSNGAAYEQFMGRWSREVGKAFLAWLQPPKGAHWLDVGCGTGILTELISASCTPASMIAVDPAPSQIAHAHKGAGQAKAEFRIADAQELPFPDKSFDVVASSLVLNFVPVRTRAMSEMRRVVRPGGMIAACVWDFAEELSPSGPLRRAIQRIGIAPPPIPGTEASTLAALTDLFVKADLKGVAATAVEVTVAFPSFEDFWHSQTPSYTPLARLIDAMSWTERLAVKEALHAELQASPAGIRYAARANAIKGHL